VFPQIPTIQLSNWTTGEGSGTVRILGRGNPAGDFFVKLDVKFRPVDDPYPHGKIRITVNLTDSMKGTATSTHLHQLASIGHDTPTLFVSGRCGFDPSEHKRAPIGCQFWMLIANNGLREKREQPDVISFLILDRSGARVAYGTGPVVDGDFWVQSEN
jgi:hypothetical protein